MYLAPGIGSIISMIACQNEDLRMRRQVTHLNLEPLSQRRSSLHRTSLHSPQKDLSRVPILIIVYVKATYM